jgi:superfamily II DNA or RNA helicase
MAKEFFEVEPAPAAMTPPTVTERILAMPHQTRGKAAELAVAELYRNLGYTAKVSGGAGDNGVDLILTAPTGERIAVQVKAYASPVGANTVTAEYAVYSKHKAQHKCDRYFFVSFSGYANTVGESLARGGNITLVGPTELNRMSQMATGRAQSISLMPHNLSAYTKVQEALNAGKSVMYSSGTGTGKRFVSSQCALQVANRNGDILVVAQAWNVLDQHTDLLSKYTDRIKAVTYAGLSAKMAASKPMPKADFILLDEVHRAGAENWGPAINALRAANPTAQVLGTSATPLRTDGVDTSTLFDEVVNGFTLSEAIASAILPTPEFAFGTTGVVERIEAAIANEHIDQTTRLNLQDLLKTVGNSTVASALYAVAKNGRSGQVAHVFCEDIAGANAMERELGNAFKGKPGIVKVLTVHSRSDLNSNRVVDAINSHKGKAILVVISVGMFSEGLHPDRETPLVFLHRPTSSHIIGLQQIGRAFSAGGSTPLIVDLVGMSTQMTGDVACLNVQSGIDASIAKANADRAVFGLPMVEPVTVKAPEWMPSVGVDGLKEIERVEAELAVAPQVIMAKKVVVFVREHGKLPVIKKCEEGNFLYYTRWDQRHGKTIPEAVMDVFSTDPLVIGFFTAKTRVRVKRRPEGLSGKIELAKKVVEYCDQFGRLPAVMDKLLYDFLYEVRWSQNKERTVPKAVMDILMRCEFCVQYLSRRVEPTWQQNFESLNSFVAENGRLPVMKEGPIGRWVGSQRVSYRKETLPETQISELETVPGWAWRVDRAAMSKERMKNPNVRSKISSSLKKVLATAQAKSNQRRAARARATTADLKLKTSDPVLCLEKNLWFLSSNEAGKHFGISGGVIHNYSRTSRTIKKYGLTFRFGTEEEKQAMLDGTLVYCPVFMPPTTLSY